VQTATMSLDGMKMVASSTEPATSAPCRIGIRGHGRGLM
jgi:hypothetical protein